MHRMSQQRRHVYIAGQCRIRKLPMHRETPLPWPLDGRLLLAVGRARRGLRGPSRLGVWRGAAAWASTPAGYSREVPRARRVLAGRICGLHGAALRSSCWLAPAKPSTFSAAALDLARTALISVTGGGASGSPTRPRLLRAQAGVPSTTTLDRRPRLGCARGRRRSGPAWLNEGLASLFERPLWGRRSMARPRVGRSRRDMPNSFACQPPACDARETKGPPFDSRDLETWV